MVLDNITTKPQVFHINYELVSNEGFFPLICYSSSINIKDTIALKAENEKVKKEVNQIFLGINQNGKYIVYQAFNDIPQDIKKGVSFKMIDYVNDTLPKKAF